MKKTVIVLLLSLVLLSGLCAKSNLYFALGPYVSANVQALDKATTAYKTVGLYDRLGIFYNTRHSVFVSADVQYCEPVASYSQFSALSRCLTGTASVGAGYYFDHFAILGNLGIRAINFSLEQPNIFLMGQAGLTAEFVLAQKNKHSLIASVPFTFGLSKNGSFFTTGVGIFYQYGVQE